MSKGPKGGGFNTPFADVARRLKAEARDAARRDADPRPARGAARTPSGRPGGPAPATSASAPSEPAPRPRGGPRPPPDDPRPAPDDDAALFLAAVGEVAPVPQAKASRKPKETRRPARLDDDEDAEVLAVLSDLVAGDGTLDVADTDEYVEGLAQGIDRRLLGRLRRGEFSVQAHLDLHGMLQDTARHAVRRFLVDSRSKGLRCVLVIHGRGKNSRDKEPVLKKALVRWLSRGGLGKQILAFSTARPTDGGAGAVYVLLRR